jgi:DNA modification methylase
VIRLLPGDCREVLATLPADSVQCVVTSPPYYGLRDYGTAQWDGGDAACDHRGAPQRTRATLNANWGEGYADVKNAEAFHPFRDTCGKCGATRVDRQIGLEATPDEYLATMVAVFREVRRVLRPDGTCWVNMGDGFCDKQLLMMPARLALALQADGWWLRSDIIWHKPNPMPESCTDRPTSAHEHVFLLTKRSRYFYDADAVREDSITDDPRRPYGSEGAWQMDGRPPEQRHGGEPRAPANVKRGGFNGKTNALPGREAFRAFTASRNLRNVWTIATAPYSDAHFATFPPALAERCIKAGSRPGDTVLDPFAGAGTTLLVADRLQRDAIGIELNAAYTEMAMERCRADAPLFAALPPAEPPEDERMADLFREAAD